MEDRPGRWGKLVPAVVALVDLAATYPVKLARLAARRAVDALRPALVAKPVKARILVGEVGVELPLGVLLHRVILSCSTVRIPDRVHDVKG